MNDCLSLFSIEVNHILEADDFLSFEDTEQVEQVESRQLDILKMFHLSSRRLLLSHLLGER